MSSKPERPTGVIPNSRWINIGNALVRHGECLCNINKWPEPFTPEHVRGAVSMMIFEPALECEVKDYNPETGIFKLVRTSELSPEVQARLIREEMGW